MKQVNPLALFVRPLLKPDFIRLTIYRKKYDICAKSHWFYVTIS